jgi:hypothetical protein
MARLPFIMLAEAERAPDTVRGMLDELTLLCREARLSRAEALALTAEERIDILESLRRLLAPADGGQTVSEFA